MYDVAVAGGGPAGCYLALCLARRGRRVFVAEEHRRIGLPARCTGLIGEEAFARFDLPQEATERPVAAVNVYGPRGTAVRYAAPEPFARVVNRPRFDAALAERARAAGAEFALGQRVTAVETGPDGCRLALSSGGFVRAKCAVLATGGRSLLPAALGLGRLPGFIFGAQVETAAEGVEEVEVYVGRDLCPGSFAWVVPAAPGRARIGLTAYDRPAERLAAFLADARIKKRLPAGAPRPTVAPLPLGPLPATAADRLLAVGEAAGQIKTTTGGGVYYGLLGAEIAAAVLDEALQEGDLGKKRLGAYERRWRAALGKEIGAGLALRKWAARLDDGAIAFFLDLAARNGIMEAARRPGTFDWHAPVIKKILRARSLLTF